MSSIRNAELLKTHSDYKNIKAFITKYHDLNYVQFDYYVVNDLSLFTIEPDLDFKRLESMINDINRFLPAINNIFTKPLLHLKDEAVIMPIEAVQHIDKDTIQHVVSHSEVWENIHHNKIKPLKLLTRVYQDNYSIYENLVFCDTIDQVLIFTRRHMRILNDLIFTKQTIELNLLERVNHLNYFLALGKLHTGYVRFFDQFYEIGRRSLIRLNNINSELTTKLHLPVYRKNRRRSHTLPLRKTNILAMHKDYRKIYTLAKIFNKKDVKESVIFGPKRLQDLQTNYFHYCQLLLIFAIGHFNFLFDEKEKITFMHFNLQAIFKKWSLKISDVTCEKYQLIELEVVADTNYKVIFIPLVDNIEHDEELNQTIIENIRSALVADEYLICTPYDFDEYFKHECRLSISNIDSFRRVQQVVLRGMVYTDKTRKDCPFCNNKLTVHKEKSETNYKVYICKSCRMEITDTLCSVTKRPFSTTAIFNFHPSVVIKDSHDRLLKRQDSQMFFRNITELNDEMEAICPHCKTVHQKRIDF